MSYEVWGDGPDYSGELQALRAALERGAVE